MEVKAEKGKHMSPYNLRFFLYVWLTCNYSALVFISLRVKKTNIFVLMYAFQLIPRKFSILIQLILLHSMFSLIGVQIQRQRKTEFDIRLSMFKSLVFEMVCSFEKLHYSF